MNQGSVPGAGDSRMAKTSVRPQVASSVLEATVYTDNSAFLELGQGLGEEKDVGQMTVSESWVPFFFFFFFKETNDK